MNGDGQDLESASSPLAKDQDFIFSPSKSDNEMKEDNGFKSVPSKKDQEIISASFQEEKESTSPLFKKNKDLNSIHFLDMASLEKLIFKHDIAEDSSGTRSLKLGKSQSCRASITANPSSPWLKVMDSSENTPSVGSEREYKGFEMKISPLNFGSNVERLATKDSESSPKNVLDIGIDTPDLKFSTAEDVTCKIAVTNDKSELANKQEITKNPEMEIEPKANVTPNKSFKDVGLDPMDDDLRCLSSWPVEFKTLQREIVELWKACNVSLVHRAYFFLLFQGDPSDAIYLEVEMRRMRFLKDKFSRGEKTIVNGQQLTLASSARALRHERRMLSKQMLKKFSEHERESLFLKWGIGLNTKLRRLQLAYHVWTRTEDMNHIADSAFLVVKLVGFIEPGQAPKEMFGLNFTPRHQTRAYSFKRSLASLL